MRLIKMKCDSCGADLELNLDHLQVFCPYCGQKLFIDTDHLGQIISEKEKTKRAINAEEYKTKRKQMAYENKSKENDKDRKETSHFLIGCVVLFFALFGILHSMSSNENKRRDEKTAYLQDLELKIEDALNAGDYDTALIAANKLYGDKDLDSKEKEIWDEKRAAFIQIIEDRKKNAEINSPDTIFMPTASSYLEGKNYKEVEKQFRELGFTNITTQVSAKTPGWFDKNESVEHILVGGKSSFTEEDCFNKDSVVIIYYYWSN